MQSLGDGRPEDSGDGQRQIAAASKDIRHLGKEGWKALHLTAEDERREERTGICLLGCLGMPLSEPVVSSQLLSPPLSPVDFILSLRSKLDVLLPSYIATWLGILPRSLRQAEPGATSKYGVGLMI